MDNFPDVTIEELQQRLSVLECSLTAAQLSLDLQRQTIADLCKERDSLCVVLRELEHASSYAIVRSILSTLRKHV